MLPGSGPRPQRPAAPAAPDDDLPGPAEPGARRRRAVRGPTTPRRPLAHRRSTPTTATSRCRPPPPPPPPPPKPPVVIISGGGAGNGIDWWARSLIPRLVREVEANVRAIDLDLDIDPPPPPSPLDALLARVSLPHTPADRAETIRAVDELLDRVVLPTPDETEALTAAERKSLAATLDELRRDLGDLRAALATERMGSSPLDQRMAALEARLDAVLAVSVAPPAAAAPVPTTRRWRWTRRRFVAVVKKRPATPAEKVAAVAATLALLRWLLRA